jgi:hypothetical protein
LCLSVVLLLCSVSVRITPHKNNHNQKENDRFTTSPQQLHNIISYGVELSV